MCEKETKPKFIYISGDKFSSLINVNYVISIDKMIKEETDFDGNVSEVYKLIVSFSDNRVEEYYFDSKEDLDILYEDLIYYLI